MPISCCEVIDVLSHVRCCDPLFVASIPTPSSPFHTHSCVKIEELWLLTTIKLAPPLLPNPNENLFSGSSFHRHCKN